MLLEVEISLNNASYLNSALKMGFLKKPKIDIGFLLPAWKKNNYKHTYKYKLIYTLKPVKNKTTYKSLCYKVLLKVDYKSRQAKKIEKDGKINLKKIRIDVLTNSITNKMNIDC